MRCFIIVIVRHYIFLWFYVRDNMNALPLIYPLYPPLIKSFLADAKTDALTPLTTWHSMPAVPTTESPTNFPHRPGSHHSITY